jgi:hypothetical protein
VSIHHVAGLLAALGLSSTQGLVDLLVDEFDDPDAAVEVEPDGTLTVISYGRLGVGIEFPTTPDAFWEAVRDN